MAPRMFTGMTVMGKAILFTHRWRRDAVLGLRLHWRATDMYFMKEVIIEGVTISTL